MGSFLPRSHQAILKRFLEGLSRHLWLLACFVLRSDIAFRRSFKVPAENKRSLACRQPCGSNAKKRPKSPKMERWTGLFLPDRSSRPSAGHLCLLRLACGARNAHCRVSRRPTKPCEQDGQTVAQRDSAMLVPLPVGTGGELVAETPAERPRESWLHKSDPDAPTAISGAAQDMGITPWERHGSDPMPS